MRSMLVLVLFLMQLPWTHQCNPLTGPAGTTACVQLVGYTNYQWATCVSNNYIKEKSSHRHACVLPGAIYCWYQCMVEVHSVSNGLVTKDCSCTPGRILTSSLPQACYSPSGESCNWYSSCLRRKYPCEDASNAYAVTYAERFCMLYNERRAIFSAEGQKWLDAVRKCLQVDLVPLVRPWVTASCHRMRQRALATHIPCYLKPDQNVTSVCDLNCTDYLKIVWSIKGSFMKMDTAWGSIKDLWNVEIRCFLDSPIRQCLNDEVGERGTMKVTRISLKRFKQKGAARTSVSLLQDDAASRFADGVGSSIAELLKWNTVAMDWIAYTENFAAHDDQDITMVLADRKALGIATTSTPSVDFNHTIHQFASAIAEGKLLLQVDGYNVWVRSLSSCSDKSCARTQTLAVSDKPPNWPNGATRILHVNIGLFGIIVSLLMCRPCF